MKEFLASFSTREISILIWIGIVSLAFIIGYRDIRKSLFKTIKILLSKTIVLSIGIIALYSGIIIFLFYQLNLWNLSLLKDTIIWFLATPLIVFFNIDKANGFDFFKDVMKDAVKLIIAIEFISNFYTFPLIWELLLIPSLTITSMLQFVAGKRPGKDDQQASRMLKAMMSIYGLLIFGYSLYMTITRFDQITQLNSLESFLLPPVMTLLIIPILYMLALLFKYETLLVKVKYMSKDTMMRKLIKRNIFKFGNINLSRISNISKKIRIYELNTPTEIKEHIRSIAVVR